MRPILGSTARKMTSDCWMTGPQDRTRLDSLSSNDFEEGSSVVSPIVSPIGSPLRSSPIVCLQNVNTLSNESLLLKRFLCDSPQNDFELNGKEVPIGTALNNNMAFNPFNPMPTSKDYQLFNGFTYADISPFRSELGITSKPVVPAMTRMKRRLKTQTFCTFCKNNNETPEVYNSHVVKDVFGRTSCPVLRRYNCPKCNSGGGDNGHTLRYCPLNRPEAQDYQPSIIKMLKNSRSADGKKKSVS